MKTLFDIRKWTRPVSYERGKRIYMEGRVLSCDVDALENDIEAVTANVRGSGRNVYQSEIELNTRTFMIRDYYCECPAFDAYPSLCKHCVAALLKYQEIKRRRGTAPLPEEDAKKEGGRAFRTPLLLKELMQKRAQMKALPVIQSSIYGKVRLLVQ